MWSWRCCCCIFILAPPSFFAGDLRGPTSCEAGIPPGPGWIHTSPHLAHDGGCLTFLLSFLSHSPCLPVSGCSVVGCSGVERGMWCVCVVAVVVGGCWWLCFCTHCRNCSRGVGCGGGLGHVAQSSTTGSAALLRIARAFSACTQMDTRWAILKWAASWLSDQAAFCLRAISTMAPWVASPHPPPCASSTKGLNWNPCSWHWASVSL